jgi:hypothetical protein
LAKTSRSIKETAILRNYHFQSHLNKISNCWIILAHNWLMLDTINFA